MKVLLFVSVFVVLICVGVLVAVIAASARKSEGSDQEEPPRFGRKPPVR